MSNQRQIDQEINRQNSPDYQGDDIDEKKDSLSGEGKNDELTIPQRKTILPVIGKHRKTIVNPFSTIKDAIRESLKKKQTIYFIKGSSSLEEIKIGLGRPQELVNRNKNSCGSMCLGESWSIKQWVGTDSLRRRHQKINTELFSGESKYYNTPTPATMQNEMSNNIWKDRSGEHSEQRQKLQSSLGHLLDLARMLESRSSNRMSENQKRTPIPPLRIQRTSIKKAPEGEISPKESTERKRAKTERKRENITCTNVVDQCKVLQAEDESSLKYRFYLLLIGNNLFFVRRMLKMKLTTNLILNNLTIKLRKKVKNL